MALVAVDGGPAARTAAASVLQPAWPPDRSNSDGVRSVLRMDRTACNRRDALSLVSLLLVSMRDWDTPFVLAKEEPPWKAMVGAVWPGLYVHE